MTPIPIIIGMPLHIIMTGAPMAIMAIIASQRSFMRAIIDGSVGIIFIIMPSFVISQVMVHIMGIMPPIIMGIIIPMPFIIGIIMPMPFIMGIMGIMPPIGFIGPIWPIGMFIGPIWPIGMFIGPFIIGMFIGIGIAFIVASSIGHEG
ncbi:hypothetical protein AKJ09_10757 [Labilithrix luteola]|uniref:Uncharacterized protein n=1 Tax=Labilithrix luteola TaxID=1391654 RepID=A0A0K1QEA6_9BACT|nr:hypothetical protein [Labilithrix luteola]AKV04094.1 hypothetical protein AKJ09_10757 [Labilithrix luteola]